MEKRTTVQNRTGMKGSVPVVFQFPINMLKDLMAGFGMDASCIECWFINSPNADIVPVGYAVAESDWSVPSHDLYGRFIGRTNTLVSF